VVDEQAEVLCRMLWVECLLGMLGMARDASGCIMSECAER
jgi:hypothetical protein